MPESYKPDGAVAESAKRLTSRYFYVEEREVLRWLLPGQEDQKKQEKKREKEDGRGCSPLQYAPEQDEM